MTNKVLIKNKIKKKNIAIIGGGISGLSCALILSKKFNITLYESNNYLGGHAKTISNPLISETNKEKIYNYDVGFLVYNDKNYPYFSRLIKELGVQTINTEMSFSVTNKKSNFEYGSTGFLALTNSFKNLLNKNYWILLFDIIKFYNISKKNLDEESFKSLSVKDFLNQYKFKSTFVKEHLIPMCGAIWSSSAHKVLEMPIIFIINFFNNHGLLNLYFRPKWKTIKNGSASYVKQIEIQLKGPIYKNEKVYKVYRKDKSVTIKSTNFTRVYDNVIMALHTDKILSILDKPTKLEKIMFSQLKYEKNKVFVHQDPKLMPYNKKVWSAWNSIIFNKNKDGFSKKNICVTYWINKLQNIKTKNPLFVTLNPPKNFMPKKEKIIKIIEFSHPLFNLKSSILKPKLKYIQGYNNTFYIGAWTGNGFHEDGIKSAIEIANRFNVKFYNEDL